MSLLPASNGPIAPHHHPHMQTPLPPQQQRPSGHDVSQPNPRDTLSHSNNSGYPDFFSSFDSFPLSTFSASNAVQGFVLGVNPSHPSYMNDQSLSDIFGPTAIPPPGPQDGSSQYMPTNQTFQAVCTCSTCVHHRTVGPAQFRGGEPGHAGHEATAPSAQPSPSSSRRGRTTPYTRPPARRAPTQYPGVIDPGSDGSAADTGYARRLNPVRNRRRRVREVPLVRVEDRIDWVRRDLLKMTLWFNWSPDAEARAHDPWGELPRVESSVNGAAPTGVVSPAPSVHHPLPRSG